MNPKAKILIVEDSPMNINLLVSLLNEKYEVLVAKDGAQALKRAHDDPLPDLILLDINLPDLSGYDVCRRFKADSLVKDIPIIFITALDSESDEMEGLNCGAVDYITKPFSHSIVQARVKTHLLLKKSLEVQKVQNIELKKLNELKNKFLGVTAHDLRNPISVIQGMSDILLTMPLSEQDQKDVLQRIYNVSKEMNQLLDDLLDVTLIESGKFEIRRQRMDFAHFLKNRIQMCNFHAKSKQIEIASIIPDQLTCSLDESRLAQVVDNLLLNAIKFSPKGSRITVRCQEMEQELCFAVEDVGPGIPADECHKLFGAYQRLSTNATAKEKCTGLGLAIVKSIVDAHQGTIRVDSILGKGSAFKVTLPIEPRQ